MSIKLAVPCLMLLAAMAGPAFAPDALPDAIAAPAETTPPSVHAQGGRAYECKAGTAGNLAWVFADPIASLLQPRLGGLMDVCGKRRNPRDQGVKILGVEHQQPRLARGRHRAAAFCLVQQRDLAEESAVGEAHLLARQRDLDLAGGDEV